MPFYSCEVLTPMYEKNATMNNLEMNVQDASWEPHLFH